MHQLRPVMDPPLAHCDNCHHTDITYDGDIGHTPKSRECLAYLRLVGVVSDSADKDCVVCNASDCLVL
jgi:hypothetical protein